MYCDPILIKQLTNVLDNYLNQKRDLLLGKGLYGLSESFPKTWFRQFVIPYFNLSYFMWRFHLILLTEVFKPGMLVCFRYLDFPVWSKWDLKAPPTGHGKWLRHSWACFNQRLLPVKRKFVLPTVTKCMFNWLLGLSLYYCGFLQLKYKAPWSDHCWDLGYINKTELKLKSHTVCQDGNSETAPAAKLTCALQLCQRHTSLESFVKDKVWKVWAWNLEADIG